MLSMLHRKACQEDTACVTQDHISLTVAQLQRTIYIALKIRTSSYPEEPGAGRTHILRYA